MQNGNQLYDVIKNTNVRAIFAEHVHFPTSYLQAGILNVTADSTAYHIDCRALHDHYYNDTVSHNIINLDG